MLLSALSAWFTSHWCITLGRLRSPCNKYSGGSSPASAGMLFKQKILIDNANFPMFSLKTSSRARRRNIVPQVIIIRPDGFTLIGMLFPYRKVYAFTAITTCKYVTFSITV